MIIGIIAIAPSSVGSIPPGQGEAHAICPEGKLILEIYRRIALPNNGRITTGSRPLADASFPAEGGKRVGRHSVLRVIDVERFSASDLPRLPPVSEIVFLP